MQWSGRQGKSEAAAKALAAANVPFVTTPVRLARAAAILARFADDRRRLLPRKVPKVTTPKGLELPAGAVTLNEAESKAVLRTFGIPVAKEVFVAAGSRRGPPASKGSRRRSRSRSSRATCRTRRKRAA